MNCRSILVVIVLLFYFLGYTQNTNGNWSIKGPVAFPSNISGQINGIGRVSQIKFHTTDSLKIYAVSASGGLWISNDAGTNWNKTATDIEIPQGSCSAICIDYTNDSIMYLGSGDGNYYSGGNGIYKSIDKGTTWIASNSGIENLVITEILLSPNNHNTVLASTTDGIWKSTDAGATWTATKVGGKFYEIEYMPGSLNTIYAVNENEFWKSTDDGDTWTKITSVNPLQGNGGKVATTAANKAVVYVGFVGSNSTIGEGGIIYQSVDSGNTFIEKKGDVQPNLNGYSENENGQGEYNWDIFADRIDENILYAVGHVVWRSTDAGVSFNKLTDWYEKCHTDMHQIISSPYDNNKLYNINDGGVFQSTDTGLNWTAISDGLSATEVAHFGQSKLTKNILTFGSQDNGEIYLDSTTWICNRGGDWYSKSVFDYANPNVAYYTEEGNRRDIKQNTNSEPLGLPNFSTQDNYFFTDLNTSFALVSHDAVLYKTTNLLASTPTWDTLFVFDDIIQNVAISPLNLNNIYVVLQDGQILRTLDGTNFVLASSAPASTQAYSNIAVTNSDTNVVYLTCGSKVFRSADKAATWTDISGSLSSANIISLQHDPYQSNESFYLATAMGVYYKNDTMSDWRSFSKGLPLIAQITDLYGYFDGTNNSVLRVSFYGRGVWESPTSSIVSSLNNIVKNVGKINVYPNPSSDIITINCTQPELMNTPVYLIDITGKTINTFYINQPITMLKFDDLPKGVYFLKFKNNATQKVLVK